jgi:hypothetical protein
LKQQQQHEQHQEAFAKLRCIRRLCLEVWLLYSLPTSIVGDAAPPFSKPQLMQLSIWLLAGRHSAAVVPHVVRLIQALLNAPAVVSSSISSPNAHSNLLTDNSTSSTSSNSSSSSGGEGVRTRWCKATLMRWRWGGADGRRGSWEEVPPLPAEVPGSVAA